MKILVTGTTGKIGRELCTLLKQHEVDVIRHSRSHGDFDWVADLSNNLTKNLPPKCDYCIHAAGLSPKNLHSSKDYFLANALGAYHLSRALEIVGCKGVIFLSTISIYGKLNGKILTEHTERTEVGEYGASKFSAENLLLSSKLPVAIFRLPGVIGEHLGDSWLETVIFKMIKNHDVAFSNPDEFFNNVVSVGSIGKFCLSLFTRDFLRNEVFVLGSSDALRLSDLLSHILIRTNSKSNLNQCPATPHSLIDYSFAEMAGYIPDTVKDVVNSKIDNLLLR